MGSTLTVNDLMDRQFITFSPDMPLVKAVETLQSRKLFGACVVDQAKRVLGILSEKACIRFYEAIMAGKLDRPIQDVTVMACMYPDFKSVSSSTGVVQAAEIFIQSEFRRLPVVESGRLVGQITRRDIVRAVHKLGHM